MPLNRIRFVNVNNMSQHVLPYFSMCEFLHQRTGSVSPANLLASQHANQKHKEWMVRNSEDYQGNHMLEFYLVDDALAVEFRLTFGDQPGYKIICD